MEVLINRSQRAAGGGAAGLTPSPTRRARAGPRAAAGSRRRAGSGGREPNLCPSEERCLAVPAPSGLVNDSPRRGLLPGRPEVQGGAFSLRPRSRVRDSPDSLQAGSGRSAGRRTLFFRRRNVVGVSLPDSAAGIRLLAAFFKQINNLLPRNHFQEEPNLLHGF